MQENFINEMQRKQIIQQILKRAYGTVHHHHDGSMRFHVKLTADEATQILELYPSPPPHNRATNENRVKNYLRQMMNGDWSTCVDPIIISDTGFIIAGKHRLTAQSRSGQTIEWFMIFDGPESLRKGTQGGTPHSISDLLHISSNEQAVVNIIWVMTNGRLNVKIGETEARAIWNEYGDSIKEVSNILTVKPWRNAPVIAAFSIAANSKKFDKSVVLGLVNNIKDYQLLTPGASAISKTVIEKKPINQEDRSILTLQVLRGIYAHVKKEKIQKLVATDSILPLYDKKYEFKIPKEKEDPLEAATAAE